MRACVCVYVYVCVGVCTHARVCVHVRVGVYRVLECASVCEREKKDSGDGVGTLGENPLVLPVKSPLAERLFFHLEILRWNHIFTSFISPILSEV